MNEVGYAPHPKKGLSLYTLALHDCSSRCYMPRVDTNIGKSQTMSRTSNAIASHIKAMIKESHYDSEWKFNTSRIIKSVDQWQKLSILYLKKCIYYCNACTDVQGTAKNSIVCQSPAPLVSGLSWTKLTNRTSQWPAPMTFKNTGIYKCAQYDDRLACPQSH